MSAYDKASDQMYEAFGETIADIGFDIRMENYEDAEKKIELLAKLLQTIRKSNRKK